MRAEDTLAFLAKQLVDTPDEVAVDVIEENDQTILELRVAPDDIGKVIGKRGRTAKAIRAVVKAAGSLDEENIHVEIVD